MTIMLITSACNLFVYLSMSRKFKEVRSMIKLELNIVFRLRKGTSSELFRSGKSANSQLFYLPEAVFEHEINKMSHIERDWFCTIRFVTACLTIQ